MPQARNNFSEVIKGILEKKAESFSVDVVYGSEAKDRCTVQGERVGLSFFMNAVLKDTRKLAAVQLHWSTIVDEDSAAMCQVFKYVTEMHKIYTKGLPK